MSEPTRYHFDLRTGVVAPLGDFVNYREFAALTAQLAEAQRERAEAMRVLAPNVPESGLVDACRQIKQAAISEADNSSVCEAKLTAAQAEAAALREALEKAQRFVTLMNTVWRDNTPDGRRAKDLADAEASRLAGEIMALGGQPPTGGQP